MYRSVSADIGSKHVTQQTLTHDLTQWAKIGDNVLFGGGLRLAYISFSRQVDAKSRDAYIWST